MLHDLHVPFLDAAADQLVWQLGAPPQPALATARIDLGDGAGWLDVRLLGASHQVLVRRGSGPDGVRCSELVACVPGAAGALPAAAVHRVDELEYRFASTVRGAAPDDLADLAAELRGRAGEATVLMGSFPGSPHAVTAVEALVSGWCTWHLYPQTGEVVETATVLEVQS